MPVALLLDERPFSAPMARAQMRALSHLVNSCPLAQAAAALACTALQAVAFAKSFVLEKGPIILEMDTYR